MHQKVVSTSTTSIAHISTLGYSMFTLLGGVWTHVAQHNTIPLVQNFSDIHLHVKGWYVHRIQPMLALGGMCPGFTYRWSLTFATPMKKLCLLLT